jgi:hypothetical protein
MRVKIRNSIFQVKQVTRYPKNSPYLIIRTVDNDKYLINCGNFLAETLYRKLFTEGYCNLNTADSIKKLN